METFFITSLGSILFFIMVCVTIYKIGRIRDDLLEVKQLLHQIKCIGDDLLSGTKPAKSTSEAKKTSDIQNDGIKTESGKTFIGGW